MRKIETCKVIIVSSNNGGLAFEEKTWSLPQVPCSSHHRDVEVVVRAAQELGLDITILRCLSPDPRIYLAACDCEPLDNLGTGRDLGQTLGTNKLSLHHPQDPPWTKPQWLKEARDWVHEQLDLDGLPLGPLEQVKLSPMSNIFKIPTAAGTFWFKALPEFFKVEIPLVQYLNAKYQIAPDLVAADSTLGFFLTRQFPGIPLDQIKDIKIWAKALKTYAQVQIAEIDNPELDSFLPHRGLSSLAEHIQILVDKLPELASKGWLPPEDVQGFIANAPRLKDDCYKLKSLGIPETLEHGDLYCGNINATPDGILIYDWTDGCISHPFFSLDPFFAECPFPPDQERELLHHYLSQWEEIADMNTLMQAWNLAKPLALVHLAWSYFTIISNIQPQGRWEVSSSLTSLIRILAKYQGA